MEDKDLIEDFMNDLDDSDSASSDETIDDLFIDTSHLDNEEEVQIEEVTTESNIHNINAEEDDYGLSVSAKDDIYNTYFYFTDWEDEKECKKFIKKTEAIVRRSNEYKIWQAKIKEEYPVLCNDNILSNVTSEDASIELHHYPFSLYDIVDIVLCNNILKGNYVTTFDVAVEVLELHFKLKLGLVPLSRTNHELAHAGELFLARDQVFGDLDGFIEDYEDVISNDMTEQLSKIQEYTDENENSDFKGFYQ